MELPGKPPGKVAVVGIGNHVLVAEADQAEAVVHNLLHRRVPVRQVGAEGDVQKQGRRLPPGGQQQVEGKGKPASRRVKGQRIGEVDQLSRPVDLRHGQLLQGDAPRIRWRGSVSIEILFQQIQKLPPPAGPEGRGDGTAVLHGQKGEELRRSSCCDKNGVADVADVSDMADLSDMTDMAINLPFIKESAC